MKTHCSNNIIDFQAKTENHLRTKIIMNYNLKRSSAPHYYTNKYIAHIDTVHTAHTSSKQWIILIILK